MLFCPERPDILSFSRKGEGAVVHDRANLYDAVKTEHDLSAGHLSPLGGGRHFAPVEGAFSAPAEKA